MLREGFFPSQSFPIGGENGKREKHASQARRQGSGCEATPPCSWHAGHHRQFAVRGLGLSQQRVHRGEQAAQLHVRLVLWHRQRVRQGAAEREQPQTVNDEVCFVHVCFTGA